MAIDYVPELTASMAVTNIERSIEWYGSILGFTLLYRAEEIGWCEMASHMPGITVGLSENQSVQQGGGATNVWGVSDIEAAKAHLDAHGVRQDGDIQTIPGLVRLLTFYDPDGNAMMLAQSLAQN